jgi:hypothetical protein
MNTLTADPRSALVASHLVKLRGTCRDGQPVTEPMATISAQGLHLAEVRAFLIKYFGTPQDPRLDEPMHNTTSGCSTLISHSRHRSLTHWVSSRTVGRAVPTLTANRACIWVERPSTRAA